MEGEPRSDRFTEIEDRFADYEVYDRNYEKVGQVDNLFVDENDQPEYIGVKIGFLGTKSTLTPMDVVRVHEDRRVMEVSETKDKIKAGPAFDNDEEITPEYEERVRSHYGLGSLKASAAQSTYGKYYSRDSEEGGRLYAARGSYPARQRQDRADSSEVGGPGARMGDTETGEYRGHTREQEGGMRQRRRSGLREGEDELRVQRNEEELVAGTREREVGGVRVRKRVASERVERVVPRETERAEVERDGAYEHDSGEIETLPDGSVSVPVFEEELVVTKRLVVRERVIVRKRTVTETVRIEDEVRKERVELEGDGELDSPGGELGPPGGAS